MRYRFVAVILGAGLFPGLLHAADEPWALPAVVERVVAQSPGLRAAQAQVQQAAAGRREAGLMRMPSLSARSSFTRGDHPVYVFGSLMEQGRFSSSNFAIDALNHPGDLTNIQSALELGVPLFTGFELSSHSRQAELAEQKARSGESGRALGLRAQASALFLQILLDDCLLKSLDDRLAASDAELKDARRLKDRGLVLGSDYFAAESIFGGLQVWLTQVQTDRSSAAARLGVLTKQEGWNPAGTLTDSVYTIPSQVELLDTALARRPELLSAASQVEMAQVGALQARRSVLPRVQAFAALETNTNDFGSNPTNHLLGVSARVPFGDPAYFARRSAGASGEEAARRSREGLEESIRMDVLQAYENYKGTLAGLPLAKETKERAARSLELFRPLYRSGRQSIIEVLRAEEGLARAEAAYWQTLFGIHAGYVQLLSSTGSLDDKSIQDIAQHLDPRRMSSSPQVPFKRNGEREVRP